LSSWRRKALELFPEREAMLRAGFGVHTVFAELSGDLRAAYRAVPPDRAFIDRCFVFARWCFGRRQNRDLRNAAAVSFYEGLPAFAPARADLVAHLSRTDWAELQPLFYQVLPPEVYDPFSRELEAAFARQGRTESGARLAT
jgi:hypothetical protein